MRDFGIVRQSPVFPDLVGLPFPNLADIDSMSIEFIDCEWVYGSYISSTAGATTVNEDFKYTIVDVADYDYVIIPNYRKGTITAYSGLCTGAGTTINPRYNGNAPTGYTDDVYTYTVYKVDSTSHYVAASAASGAVMPILGIKVAS